LTPGNSDVLESLDTKKVGVTYGLSFLREINRFNIGFAMGVESLIDNEKYNWLLNNKGYVGFVFGINLG